MENETLQKYQLQRDFSEKLKIYLLFVKNDPMIPIGQTIGAVVAYRAEDAVNKAILDNPGKNVFFQGQFINVDEILRQVYLEEGKLKIIEEVKIKKPEEPKDNKEKFIYNAKLIADRFIEDENDKEEFKKIIEKIE